MSAPIAAARSTRPTSPRKFQVEIPRKPTHRQFNIHVGRCRRCRRRVQGRHPLQTSDALGAAAAQLGPDAQAVVVELNKQGGLSHGKVVRCLMWAHRDDLFTFLRQPGLDATNWRAELAIRFGVILRKVWGGNRTWAGRRRNRS